MKENLTNGDVVRRMSDEELAGFIMCPYGTDTDTCVAKHVDCTACSLAWLRQPAEENN